MKNRLHRAIALSGISLLLTLPALAQGYRNDNPNLRNFYMARQQIQITDDAPAVNDMRTGPSAGGAVPGGAALPRAGFGTNMSGLTTGTMRSGLPQVVNGVPPKMPAASPGLSGLKAKAGKAKAAAPKSAGPATVKSYAPYQTYGGASSGSGGGLNSSGSVSGSVLHWNKRRSGY
ncbi:MAG: hypothetical protein K2W82_07585 [Candidatus Obscuribacterales bacterium]|nr:hypothetical protein [Candidatus Obscuribacterales bacterium]